MIDMADSTWQQSAPPTTAEVMLILTDVYMGLVSLEDGSICSCAESVVSEDSVDGIQTASGRGNVTRGA